MTKILLGFILTCSVVQVLGQSSTSNIHEADSVARLYAGHTLYNRLELVQRLTGPFDDEELKFRAIFTWVCTNITNDYDAYLKNKSRRKKYNDRPEKKAEWNKQFGDKIWQKLLTQKTTVCTGYAHLLVEMARMAGIECVAIDGYGRGVFANIGNHGIPNHTWNAVRLNSQWYLCDATWASGSNMPFTHEFIPQYEDAYFNTPPEIFAMNHYPLDTTWLLLDRNYSLQEFLTRPLVYTPAVRFGVTPKSPDSFKPVFSKNQAIRFKFNSTKALDPQKISLRINRGQEVVALSNDFVSTNSGYYMDYTFQTKGIKVIHIYVEDEALISYEIKIEK